VCDVAVTESGQRTTSATGPIDGGYLDLECRVLPAGKITFDPNQRNRLTLEVVGLAETIAADFVPDIVLPNPAEKLYCAETLKDGAFPSECIFAYGLEVMVDSW
jgi:hypothetical protein